MCVTAGSTARRPPVPFGALATQLVAAATIALTTHAVAAAAIAITPLPIAAFGGGVGGAAVSRLDSIGREGAPVHANRGGGGCCSGPDASGGDIKQASSADQAI